MSHTFNFLVPEKIIEVTKAAVNNTVTISVAEELFVEAKQEWLNDPTLNKYRFPLRGTSGGVPLGNGKFSGSFFFLSNNEGWRIRPAETDHELVINGNIFGVDPSLPIFEKTNGNYNVVIRLNTSQLAETISLEGGVILTDIAYDEIAARVRTRILETTSFPP